MQGRSLSRLVWEFRRAFAWRRSLRGLLAATPRRRTHRLRLAKSGEPDVQMIADLLRGVLGIFVMGCGKLCPHSTRVMPPVPELCPQSGGPKSSRAKAKARARTRARARAKGLRARAFVLLRKTRRRKSSRVASRRTRSRPPQESQSSRGELEEGRKEKFPARRRRLKFIGEINLQLHPGSRPFRLSTVHASGRAAVLRSEIMGCAPIRQDNVNLTSSERKASR